MGETDVRIDTSAQSYSWSIEVLNKQQFEDSLRRDEPTSDESLDKLPISGEVNGEWQTFPDAAPEDAELLRNFSLICMLSYDVYVKKTIIERLIDTTTSDKSKAEKNKK